MPIMAKVLCADSGTTLDVGGLLLHRDALLKEGSHGSKQQNTILHSLSSKVLHTTHTNVSHSNFTKSLPSCYHPLFTNEKGSPRETGACLPIALGHGKYFGVERKGGPPCFNNVHSACPPGTYSVSPAQPVLWRIHVLQIV